MSILLGQPTQQPHYLERFDALKLTDEMDKTVIVTSDSTDLTLFIFLYPECPITQRYGQKIRSLAADPAIRLIGIQPNPNVSNEELVIFKSTYGYDFPIVNDPGQLSVRLFEASITPEVFLVGAQGQLIYSGAIDDWFVELGVNRSQTTRHYLDDAIRQYLAEQPILLKKTKAIGCLIEAHMHQH